MFFRRRFSDVTVTMVGITHMLVVVLQTVVTVRMGVRLRPFIPQVNMLMMLVVNVAVLVV